MDISSWQSSAGATSDLWLYNIISVSWNGWMFSWGWILKAKECNAIKVYTINEVLVTCLEIEALVKLISSAYHAQGK